MRDENKKKLNEMTSKTMSRRTVPWLAWHSGLVAAVAFCGIVREKPMNMAIVKREFTFTIPSRAVTWTLVFRAGRVRVVVVVVAAAGDLVRDFCISILQ